MAGPVTPTYAMLCALLLAAVSTPVRASSSVEPQVLIKDGDIAACGVRATSTLDGIRPLQVDVIAYRKGDATEFALTAAVAESGPATQPAIATVRLTTASHDTGQTFPQVRAIAGGRVETRAALAGLSGATFMQELLVSGGQVTLMLAGGTQVRFDLPSPMPHGVRQAYLNCAGDLFRPNSE